MNIYLQFHRHLDIESVSKREEEEQREREDGYNAHRRSAHDPLIVIMS